MLDNELIALIRSTILAQLDVAGITGTAIKQAFQPTQQGMNTGPMASLYKIGDQRIGFPSRTDRWDDTEQKNYHTEMQVYETTFQISANSTQDPTNTTQLTASDILNYLAYILQSEQTIETLIAQDVGIMAISDIRNPSFVDDRQNYAFNPNFDFTVSHKQIVTTVTDVLQSTELRILPV